MANYTNPNSYTNSAGAGATSITVDITNPPTPGNLLVFVVAQITSVTPTVGAIPPAGWTDALGEPVNYDDSTLTLQAFWKIADGTETSVAVDPPYFDIVSLFAEVDEFGGFSGPIAIDPVSNYNGVDSGTSLTVKAEGGDKASLQRERGDLSLFYLATDTSNGGIIGGDVNWGFDALVPTSGSGDQLGAFFGTVTDQSRLSNNEWIASWTDTARGLGIGLSFYDPTIGLVQAIPKTNSTNNLNITTATGWALPRQGDLLIATISHTSTGGSVGTPTDNGDSGNPWVAVTAPVAHGTTILGMWYKVATATDAANLTSVTFTNTGTGTITNYGEVDEYSGFAGPPQLDLAPTGVSHAAATSSACPATPNLTQKTPTELAVSVSAWVNANGGITNASSYYGASTNEQEFNITSITNEANLVNGWIAVGADPAAGSDGFHWAWTTSGPSVSMGATFYGTRIMQPQQSAVPAQQASLR